MLRVLAVFAATRLLLILATLSPWPTECLSYEFPSPTEPGVFLNERPPWKPAPDAPTPGVNGRLWQVVPDSPWLEPFARWDANFYFHIVAFGYRPAEGEGPVPVRAGFLPGYPYALDVTTRAVNLCTGGGFALPATFDRFWTGLLAAFLLGNGCLLLAVFILRRFVSALTEDPATGDRAAFALCLAPTSFFFSAALSEGLFLALSLASLWWAFRRRIFIAALFAAAAAFTRPVGLFLAFPLLAAVCDRRTGFGQIVRDGLKLCLIPAAFVGALAVSYAATGRWNAYFLAQAQFGHEDFPTLDGLRSLFAASGKTPLAIGRDVLQVAVLTAVVAAIVSLVRAVRARRFYLVLVVWLAIGVVFPLLSDDVISLPRYAAALFPVYVAAAISLRGRVAVVAAALALPLQIAGFLAFSRSWPILI